MLGCHPPERRRCQRVTVKLSAICRIAGPSKYLHILNGNEFEAKTSDMSETGLSILSNYFIPAGSKLHIKLMVCESDRKMFIKFYDIVRLYGEVTSSIVYGDEVFRLGIRFEEMDKKQEDKIFYLMHSALQEGNPYPFSTAN